MKNLTDNNLLEIKTRLKNTFPKWSFKVTKSADDEELYINVLESDFKISDYYFRNTKQLNITKLEDYPKENNKEYETLKEIVSIAKSEGFKEYDSYYNTLVDDYYINIIFSNKG